jgi:hypothetical protein
MTDVTAQPQTNSYVDDYMPPTQNAQADDTASDQQVLNPIADAIARDAAPVNADDNAGSAGNAGSSDEVSEALEDQNIFDLLGINEVDEQEKEIFLDELQQVIWEDFVENDVELLLTEDELKEFKAIAENAEASSDEKQSQMIDYLEKLIPDLEKIMLEKALDLKEDMTRQRITDLMQVFKDVPSTLEMVKKAQTQVDQQLWHSVIVTLNEVSATVA